MDSDFDRLHDTVGRLGEVGRVMREELEEQNLYVHISIPSWFVNRLMIVISFHFQYRVLEEFGVEADDTQSMLGQATKSVEKLIQAAKSTLIRDYRLHYLHKANFMHHVEGGLTYCIIILLIILILLVIISFSV